jgi:hypothetical protein
MKGKSINFPDIFKKSFCSNGNMGELLIFSISDNGLRTVEAAGLLLVCE